MHLPCNRVQARRISYAMTLQSPCDRYDFAAKLPRDCLVFTLEYTAANRGKVTPTTFQHLLLLHIVIRPLRDVVLLLHHAVHVQIAVVFHLHRVTAHRYDPLDERLRGLGLGLWLGW
jgi:hypothetical protein